MKTIKIFLILSILFVFGFGAEYRVLKAERAEVIASENFKLVGSFYPVKEQNPPVVLLLHMLGRNRGDWNVFARHLQKEGIAVLSLDLRGHGESTNYLKSYWRSFDLQEYQKYVPDLNSVFAYLDSKGINNKQIGILGVGIGSNVAMNYAAMHKNIKTLVLVDPGFEYQGIKIEQAIRNYGERPIFVICNAQNKYALSTVKSIQQLIKGKIKVDIYNFNSNWPYLFNNQLELQNAVTVWFKETLQGFQKIDEQKFAPEPI